MTNAGFLDVPLILHAKVRDAIAQEAMARISDAVHILASANDELLLMCSDLKQRSRHRPTFRAITATADALESVRLKQRLQFGWELYVHSGRAMGNTAHITPDATNTPCMTKAKPFVS
jgi:hypothetical protein